MKRTLLVTLDYPPMVGGVAHYYKNLVDRLPADSIFVLDDERHELCTTKKWIWPKWIFGLWNVRRAILQYHIEHLLVGQVLPIGTIVWALSFVMPIEYTVMTHAMDITLHLRADASWRKRWLTCHILQRATAITTVSAFTKRKLLEWGVPEEKIHMVYPCPHVNGLDEMYAHLECQELDDTYHIQNKTVVLSVGRLVERKGFDMVIQAMDIVRDRVPQAIYVLVGDGPYRPVLEQRVQDLHLEDRVLFVGTVDSLTLARWYARSTCVAMPSRELPNKDVEGFGIAFLEANSFGKPVIGGASGGVGDAVIDGETGFIVDPTDVTMLVKAISTLCTDARRAQELGKKGRERVAREFQWSVQAKRLNDMLS